MNDKELLEFAAKAAGIYLEWDGPPDQWQPIYYEGKTYHSWNPLTDDGDALRLAVVLNLSIFTAYERTLVEDKDNKVRCSESHADNPLAETRRAIVRAAAEIGKMKEAQG